MRLNWLCRVARQTFENRTFVCENQYRSKYLISCVRSFEIFGAVHAFNHCIFTYPTKQRDFFWFVIVNEAEKQTLSNICLA